jgi:hypothetical protein
LYKRAGDVHVCFPSPHTYPADDFGATAWPPPTSIALAHCFSGPGCAELTFFLFLFPLFDLTDFFAIRVLDEIDMR